ncbi:DUF3883 domain-containing protein [Caryophanon latum]|uniref:Protein NO VEIN C-terminal domain-containing protein n=1 Tax=Caryophanon latum TaxID=33977 RepID=A0A1C0YTT7_9BACL|nr:DUF3883 domain-containing protein [Caryophanon latum]OCS90577.1 hypothetical protein A6K76_11000 [Caryophanon latum]
MLEISKEELMTLSNDQFFKRFISAFYSKDSYKQVYSKLNTHVLRTLNKPFVEFDYRDYESIQNKKNISEDVKNYASTLFKFLFLKGILKHEEFNHIFALEKVKEHFASRAKNKDRIKVTEGSEKLNALNFEELLNIEEFYLSSQNDLDSLKKKFLWHLIRFYDFKNQQILDIKSQDFSNGQLNIAGKTIDLPKDVEELPELLSNTKNDGFTNLSGILKSLGNQLNIEKNLIPTIIRNTKIVNTICCPNCQEEYTSNLNNWCAIEEKLVCKACGDYLKYAYSYQELSNSPIEKVNNQERNLRNKENFEKNKKKLIENGIDFQRLNAIFEEIGKLGEEFVYNLEYSRLIDTKYANLIDKSPARNPKNGYDILSYEKDGTKLFIEVKATTSLDDEFYISKNELETAERILKDGGKYQVCFIKNILSDQPIVTKIDNILDDLVYCKVAQSWKISILE